MAIERHGNDAEREDDFSGFAGLDNQKYFHLSSKNIAGLKALGNCNNEG
jgi:hypothetical protein